MTDLWVENADGTVRRTDGEEWSRTRGNFKLQDIVNVGGRYCLVSTVFLGINHNFCTSGPPLLYETMVFDSGDQERCVRYSSRDAAVGGHNRIVQELGNAED